MEKDTAPIITEYCEKAEFPFHIPPNLDALHAVVAQLSQFVNLLEFKALTELDYGSDASSLKSTTTKVLSVRWWHCLGCCDGYGVAVRLFRDSGGMSAKCCRWSFELLARIDSVGALHQAAGEFYLPE
ncbi:hypothetical protein GIB67_033564 [Kingdonia uniflora]|uniref:Uncharacterized protein n=1 Tax=Kingdonia uniflora TaxID=39325 RepID=A0A7J7L6E0_9MAGN|nr:hypothetical protein GIB67_033564 [Kingdonia uniflora]